MYYFNTQEQKAGDEHYNKGEYAQALQCYEQALERLNQVTPVNDRYFQEKLYLIAELIITNAVELSILLDEGAHVQAFLESSEEEQGSLMKQKCTRIDELLDMMRLARESIHVPLFKKTEQQINEAYKQLSNRAEELSDVWTDSISYNRTFASIQEARSWFDKAIEYKMQAGLELTTKDHFSYLYLAQYQYEITSDLSVLTESSDYISKHHLMEKEKNLKWNNRLELNSYQLFIQIEKNDNSKRDYAKICQEIMKKHADELDACGELPEEASRLIERALARQEISSKEQTPKTLPRKHPGSVFSELPSKYFAPIKVTSRMEGAPSNTVDEKTVAQKSLIQNNPSSSSSKISIATHQGNRKSTLLIDCNNKIQPSPKRLYSVVQDILIEENNDRKKQRVIDEERLFIRVTSSRSATNQCSFFNLRQFSTKNTNKIEIEISSVPEPTAPKLPNVLKSNCSNNTSNERDVMLRSDDNIYAKAFINTMNHFASKEIHFANRESSVSFLCNILSMMLKFYRRSALKASGTLALGLCDALLELDPKHERALMVVEELKRQGIQNYSNKTQELVLSNTKILSVFNKAIEANVYELATCCENVNGMIELMLDLMETESKVKRVFGQQSDFFVDKMRTKYKKETVSLLLDSAAQSSSSYTHSSR